MVGKDREPPYAKINLTDAKLILLSVERLKTELEVLAHLTASLEGLAASMRQAIERGEQAVRHRQENFAPRSVPEAATEEVKDGTTVVVSG